MNIKTTSPFPKGLTDGAFFSTQANYVNRVVLNEVAWGIPAPAGVGCED